jgi:hypothetical protein
VRLPKYVFASQEEPKFVFASQEEPKFFNDFSRARASACAQGGVHSGRPT